MEYTLLALILLATALGAHIDTTISASKTDSKSKFLKTKKDFYNNVQLEEKQLMKKATRK